MLHQQTFYVITSSVFVTLPLAQAKILSCADVECPITEGTTAATCTVADRTYNVVGVVSLDTTTKGLEGFSWVKGVGAENVNDTVRNFNQSFYLGTPSGFDFGSTGACALLFTPVSDLVRSNEDGTDGTCQDLLTDSCIGRANLIVSATALSGNGSPEPISGQQNSTSDCWPVLPKSDDLRLIDSVTAIGDYNASSVMENVLFSLTPILTVFFPGNGSSNLVSQSEAYLTCVRPIDLTTASNATHNDGRENVATRHLGGSVLAFWVGLVMVCFGLFV
ncbi:uncharacterized protein B0T15DRAFT_439329 [Chaetomium strumarium]|uniref:Uncharacterized protein n=1 Tax=Chaetomium strumarium TaxID=1170767 RepID=A0AAJ0LZT4_9PEZI|nr:hypothetical protein B0T15DRAFT_439329 [Chaetomium strumarium]